MTGPECDRIRMRAFKDEDAGAMVALFNDTDTVRYLARVPYPYSEQDAAEFIARAQKDPGHIFAMERKSDGAFIGGIGLHEADDSVPGLEGAEVGYWLGKPYWGQGLISEAVVAVVDYAFSTLHIPMLWAEVAIDNPPSQRVLAKAGFRITGEVLSHLVARNTNLPTLSFCLTRAEWLSSQILPQVFVSAVALVDVEGRVLVAQRPEEKSMAGLWEFPGGKIEPGETPETALIRELKEELDIDVTESCLAPFTFASHAYDDFHLLMYLYVCRVWEGLMTPRDRQALKWMRPIDMRDLAMPPADVSLVALLRDFV